MKIFDDIDAIDYNLENNKLELIKVYEIFEEARLLVSSPPSLYL